MDPKVDMQLQEQELDEKKIQEIQTIHGKKNSCNL